jgi:hypothetical protein
MHAHFASINKKIETTYSDANTHLVGVPSGKSRHEYVSTDKAAPYINNATLVERRR